MRSKYPGLSIMLLFVFFLTVLFGAGAVLNGQTSAKKIAVEMIERDDGMSRYRLVELVTCRYKAESGRMTCSSRPVKKIIENIAKDTGKSNRDEISMAVIVKPVMERNTAFLQYDYDNGSDSDQWIYFPSMKKLKRIVSQGSSGPKDGALFGSEIAYEDAEKMHVSDFEYSYLGHEKADGKECTVIEMHTTGKRVSRSSYRNIKVWIDTVSKIAIRTEKYNRKGKLVKTFYNKNIIKTGGVWMPGIIIVVNHQTKRMTMERVLRMAVNVAVPDALFKRRALQDVAFREGHMKQVRDAVK